MISPHVRHFICKVDLPEPFAYQPGQFITILFEHQGKTLRRSYSIANAPMQDNRIEFSAGFVENGPGTQFLFNLKPNDRVQTLGPFGRLILKEPSPERYILIATSTGVTPYRAMIPALMEQIHANPALSITILQGVQKREDVLFLQDFLTFASHPRVSFRAHLSRESQTLLDYEYLGHVQTSFETLALNASTDLVYLCGNPQMIDESFAYFKEHGFTTQQIIREKYISGKQESL